MGGPGTLPCLTFVGDSEPEIRYARSGDVHIAYTVIGDGPLDLVLVEGYFTHLGIIWEQPAYRCWVHRLASFARVIRFDKRGMGLSDRVQIGTLEQRMDDLRAVLDAVGSEQTALVGTSEGGPLSLLFAATLPDRTAALVLVGAEVRERVTVEWPWGERTDAQFELELADIASRVGSPGTVPGPVSQPCRGRRRPDVRVVEAPRARVGWGPERRSRSSGWRSRSTSAPSAARSTYRRSSCTGKETASVTWATAGSSPNRSMVPPTASYPVMTTCRG